MTHSELAKLAQDIFQGQVFCSWMIESEHMQYLERIFVPLQWAAKGKYKLPEDIATLYEYHDKAWPLKIEGYPVFFSMKFLTKEELDKIKDMLRTLRKVRDAFEIAMRSIDVPPPAAGDSDSDNSDPRPEVDQG